jgi:hypothetical protein
LASLLGDENTSLRTNIYTTGTGPANTSRGGDRIERGLPRDRDRAAERDIRRSDTREQTSR